MQIRREEMLLRLLRFQRHVNHLLESFSDENYQYFVLDYRDGSNLLTLLEREGRLSEDNARTIVQQIALGLRALHQRGILHRDIKLENIILDRERRCQICDFGVSRYMGGVDRVLDKCGTAPYMAPEMRSGRGYSGFKSDV